jgi:hypothetical protein
MGLAAAVLGHEGLAQQAQPQVQVQVQVQQVLRELQPMAVQRPSLFPSG